MTMDKKKKESLLKEFPALESIINRVQCINGVIRFADLNNDDGRGLKLAIQFDFDSSLIQYSLCDLKDIEKMFKVCGITSLRSMTGQYVRIEEFHQASWCPFFRVSHIIDDERSFVFRYAPEEIERYERGEPV